MTLDAMRQTRISNLQEKGIEQKTHMEAYGKESKEGKQDLIHSTFEHMLDTASKIAGQTRRQYDEWRETEKLEKKRDNGRGRSMSRRKKKRNDTWGPTERSECGKKRSEWGEGRRSEEKGEKR